jgi:hypothetical protein
MTKKISLPASYRIKAPEHFYTVMGHDVALLRDKGSFETCTTVIFCCIDAIAAGAGDAARSKFSNFVKKYFPTLCTELEGTVPGKSGADILYDKYRNGFAHLRAQKSGFAIANDSELEGRYATEVEIKGRGTWIAINVDRLINDFIQVVANLRGSRTRA